eukprot:symbB.v1.2.019147.t1/scaffold1555.1/size186957/1
MVFRTALFLGLVLPAFPYRHQHLNFQALNSHVEENLSTSQFSPRIVTFRPGKLGITMVSSGEITYVGVGSQAAQLGLRAGEYITKIGDKPFNYARMVRTMKLSTSNSVSFQITVEPPSWLAVKAKQVFLALSILPGFVGGLLVLALPWMLFSVHRFGWTCSVVNRILSHPVMLALIVTQAAAKTGVAVANGINTDFLLAGEFCGKVMCSAGAILGCVFNFGNPLVKIPLNRENEESLRKIHAAAWAICSMNVLSLTIMSCLESGHIDISNGQQLLFEVADVLPSFLMVAFTCLVSHISMAASQQMLDLAKTLPCKPDQFEEQIHKKCANILRTCPHQLSTCGWPLVAVIFGSMGPLVGMYAIVNTLLKWVAARTYFTNWLNFSYEFSGVAAALWPLSGVYLLSFAHEALAINLNDTRESDASSHLQVQAVEAMLANVNYGHGWGIPVFKGLVLSKEFAKTVCFRFLLACTAIITFLDAQLGYQEEEEETMTFKVNYITDLLKNMTNAKETGQIGVPPRCIPHWQGQLLLEAFRRYEHNDEGELSMKDVRSCLADIGIHPSLPPEKRAVTEVLQSAQPQENGLDFYVISALVPKIWEAIASAKRQDLEYWFSRSLDERGRLRIAMAMALPVAYGAPLNHLAEGGWGTVVAQRTAKPPRNVDATPSFSAPKALLTASLTSLHLVRTVRVRRQAQGALAPQRSHLS